MKKAELQKIIREEFNKVIKEQGGYVELITMDPNFEKGMMLINKAWSEWVRGPETKHTMIQQLRKVIKEEIKILLKEYSHGNPVLPLGKVNLITGDSKYFNIYETWDGTAEVWKDLDPGQNYKLVFTAGNKPLAKKDDKKEFYHDQSGARIGYWTFIDSARVKDMKKIALKYGKRTMSGYAYK